MEDVSRQELTIEQEISKALIEATVPIEATLAYVIHLKDYALANKG